MQYTDKYYTTNLCSVPHYSGLTCTYIFSVSPNLAATLYCAGLLQYYAHSLFNNVFNSNSVHLLVLLPLFQLHALNLSLNLSLSLNCTNETNFLQFTALKDRLCSWQCQSQTTLYFFFTQLLPSHLYLVENILHSQNWISHDFTVLHYTPYVDPTNLFFSTNDKTKRWNFGLLKYKAWVLSYHCLKWEKKS